MRFIDTSLLLFPDGWQARARQALDELRAEIAEATQRALDEHTDELASRKAAIESGLKKSSRQRIWRDLQPSLALLSKEKCWYSECLNPGSDKDVDHFRPKARVDGEGAHEGYWWLAFSVSNFRLACQWSNQRRIGNTCGGKADQFPLMVGAVRAMNEGDDLDLEDPVLLDPTDPEDWRLLTFLPDGFPHPAEPEGTKGYFRAQQSIEIYHLHCRAMVNSRFALVGMVQRIIQELDRLRPHLTDLRIRRAYKRCQCDLLRAIHPSAEFSAAARAFARAEIYKFEAGAQQKRAWLEEMLN